MPFLAVLRYDLRTLVSSWLVRCWLVGGVLLTLLLVATWWTHLRSAELATSVLMPYLVGPWFLVVVVLGADPVSAARIEALADGILSRPITRTEYLLASWSARLITVLGGYLVVVVPVVVWVAHAQRKVPADTVTLYGAAAALTVVGLVQAALVSVSYLLGTLLRRPLMAVVVALFLWFPSNLVLSTFSLETFSTVSLSQALPTLFRTPWSPETASEKAAEVGLDDLAASTSQFLRLFGGGAVEPPPRPKGFFDRREPEPFPLRDVALAYGLTSVGCLGLTLLSFWTRDL